MIPLTNQQAIEAIYQGVSADKIPLENDEIIKYNIASEILGFEPYTEPEFTHAYLMPDEYMNIDLWQYLSPMCKNDIEKDRVRDELDLIQYAGASDLIKYLIYLKDIMEQKKLIWGIGRGSSVSMFILYLIGIHKIHSIKYNLDYTDFLKIS